MSTKERKALARKMADSLYRKIKDMEGHGVSYKTRSRIGEAYRLLCDAHWKMAMAANGT